jgi:hypothetical protein
MSNTRKENKELRLMAFVLGKSLDAAREMGGEAQREADSMRAEISHLRSTVEKMGNGKHGRTMYINRGCRCDVCCAGNSEYQKIYARKRRLAQKNKGNKP